MREVNLRASESLDSEGMSVRQYVKHYFQGAAVPGVEHIREVTEPTAANGGAYLLRDSIEADELVWSPCGGGRDLNVATRIVLKNNAAKTGTGTAKISAGWMKRVFALRWRTCT